MIYSLEQGQRYFAANDKIISPTYVPDLVNNCLDLIIDNERGVWHLVNSTALTSAEFALQAAHAGELNASLIKSFPESKLGLKAKKTAYSVLASENEISMPCLKHALPRYFFGEMF